MNKEQVIAWAREARFEQLGPDIEDWVCFTDEIERFAALVAAAEREACAKVVDENAKQCGVAVRLILESNAAAIRARGETK